MRAHRRIGQNRLNVASNPIKKRDASLGQLHKKEMLLSKPSRRRSGSAGLPRCRRAAGSTTYSVSPSSPSLLSSYFPPRCHTDRPVRRSRSLASLAVVRLRGLLDRRNIVDHGGEAELGRRDFQTFRRGRTYSVNPFPFKVVKQPWSCRGIGA